MKTKQTMEVIMLPTEQISSIALFDKLMYNKDGFDPHVTNTQYLYFVSDNEIKEGDWYYTGEKTSKYGIHQCNSKRLEEIIKQQKDVYGIAKKIEVTRDPLLGCGYQHECKKHNIGTSIEKHIKCTCFIENKLPQIPQSFIEAFVKAEGKITEVDVEMEEYMTDGWIPSYNNPDNHNLEQSSEIDYKVKTRSDNTAIIHQTRTYTKDEVIKLIDNYIEEKENFGIDRNKWIKENL